MSRMDNVFYKRGYILTSIEDPCLVSVQKMLTGACLMTSVLDQRWRKVWTFVYVFDVFCFGDHLGDLPCKPPAVGPPSCRAKATNSHGESWHLACRDLWMLQINDP